MLQYCIHRNTRTQNRILNSSLKVTQFRHNNSDTDTMLNVKLKTEIKSPVPTVDKSSADSDVDYSESEDVKPLVVHESVLDRSSDGHSLRKKFNRYKTRKRQLEESITFQEQVLKRMKLEYHYLKNKVDVLSDKLDIQRTIELTGTRSNKLLPSMFQKVENFKPIIKAEVDKVEDFSSFEVPAKDELIDTKCDNKSELNIRKPKPFKHCCGICDQRFMQTLSFTDHLKSHTGFRMKCEKCPSRAFTSSKAFKRHNKWHTDGEKLFACEECPKTFEFQDRLSSHKASHQEPNLLCCVHSDCGKNKQPKRFTFPRERKQHEDYAKKPKMFQCVMCDGLFQSPQLIRIHHNRNGHNGIRRLSEEQ